MRLSLVVILGSLLFLTSCAGRQVVLHPITGSDIYDGTTKGDKCFSAFYLNEIMQVKIEGHK